MVICNWFDAPGHAWAEFFLPPYGWIPADPSMADLAETNQKGKIPEAEASKFLENIGAPSRNRDWYFGNLYPRRLIILAGENVTFRSADGTERTFHFLQPGGENAYPKSVEWAGFITDPIVLGFYLFGEGCDDETKARVKMEEELGDAYREAKKYQKAIESYQKYLTAGKGNQLTYFNLGQCYQNLGEFESAINAYEASRLAPPAISAAIVSAWTCVCLGICLDRLNRREEAVREYQAALDSGIEHENLRELAEKGLKTKAQQ